MAKSEYMLSVDGKPREVAKTLEEAKTLAAPYIAQKKKLKIDLYATSGLMLTLIYDYEIEDWRAIGAEFFGG
jgi:hypothetical protein